MIRDATPDDLPDIARLHAANWRAAYRGMLPDSFLDRGVDDYMAGRWAALPGPGWRLRVASGAGGLRGFASFATDTGEGPYLDNLHVASKARGAGLGRALMRDMAEILCAAGQDRAYLIVLKDNAGARAIYQKLGGTEGAPFDDEIAGHHIESLPVRWSTLAPLLV